MNWILDLIRGLFAAWLGEKTCTAESLGKAEDRSVNEADTIKVMQDEAQAKADAPTSMEALIAKQKAGKE